MQTEQAKHNVKSIFSGNIYKNYRWFAEHVFSKMNEASFEFLNADLGLKFLGASEKDNLFFAGEEYFVTKIRISKEHSVLIRISKTAVSSVLDMVFGLDAKTKSFNLEDLTELEAKILTSLNDFLFKSVADIFVDIPNSSKRNKEGYDCHLTFFIKGQSEDSGKIIITIPSDILPELPSYSKEYNFPLDYFPKVQVPVNLIVGKSRISLNDVKNIEVEDIVVLEKSNINTMTICVKDYIKQFKLAPDPSLIVSFGDGEGDEDDGGVIMDTSVTQTMWDSIQVDISAEFEQVKIPLGDLRQISEGLVVDIGSVYENKIDLKVENKIIASGELVIINDRYGVRVDTVYNSSSKSQPQSQEAVEPNSIEEEPKAQVEEEFNEDDFDYGNFEIDDDDI